MTQTSRYTVHVDGRHDPIAVRDRLHGCLSEWEVVADVHVTAGDGRYDVTVDWDTDHPDWAEECWPMHAADALGHAAERVDGVADAVVVCHDQPEPTTTVVDASPPRPPYRLPAGDQGGAANGTQIAVDGRSGPDAALTMGEPSQGLTEADLATIAARANAHSRQDILRLVAEVRRLEADLDRAVDRALEHRGGEAQARHQLARVTSRAEAAEVRRLRTALARCDTEEAIEAPGSSTRAGEPTAPNGEGAGNGPDSAAGGRTRSAATPTMGGSSQGLTEAGPAMPDGAQPTVEQIARALDTLQSAADILGGYAVESRCPRCLGGDIRQALAVLRQTTRQPGDAG